MDVVAEDKLVTDGDNVSGRTIVGRGNALRGDQFGWNRAENFTTFQIK